MEIITWECEIYSFLAKHWAFLDPFQSHGKDFLAKNMVMYVFSNKIRKICYILWKNVHLEAI